MRTDTGLPQDRLSGFLDNCRHGDDGERRSALAVTRNSHSPDRARLQGGPPTQSPAQPPRKAREDERDAAIVAFGILAILVVLATASMILQWAS